MKKKPVKATKFVRVFPEEYEKLRMIVHQEHTSFPDAVRMLFALLPIVKPPKE